MNTKTKILIAEHDPVDLELLINELKKSDINYEYQVVDTDEGFCNAIKSFIPDIILSDYTFPSFDGNTAFKIKQELVPDTPFIIVTGTLGEEVTVALIKNGVTDYVLKDKLFTLTSKIKRSLRDAIEKNEKNFADDKSRAQAVLLNTIGQAVMAADLNGIINFWNKEAEVTYGWSAEEAIGSNILDLIPSQQTKEQATEIMAALHQGNSWSGELVMQRKNGTSFTAFITDSPVYDIHNNLTGIIGISSDLTERKRTEDKLNKANRLYSLISEINKTITIAKDEQFLFEKACNIACSYGKFMIAWVGKVDTEVKTINLEKQCGLSDDNLLLFANVPYEKDGPHDKVLRSGASYISNDIETDLKLSKWKEFASANGIRSCMVLPLKKSGVIVSTFNLYSAELNWFDEAEINMLAVVAADISFGLEIIEKEKIQRQTEELLIKRERLFRAIIEHSADMKTLVDLDGKVIYASPSVSKVLGYTLRDFINISPNEIIHPDDISSVYENIQKIIQNGGSFFSQHRMKHKNGNYLWCEGTITNMLHDSHVNALVSNFRDISEKKYILQQHEFNQNNLNALINNTDDLMWSVDKEFKLITSNKSFNEVVSVLSNNTIEAGVGKNVLNLGFSREQSERYKKYYERAFSGENFKEIEYTDASIEYWTVISFNPIFKDKEIIGTACHSHNITDIKKSEKQIKESEAFTRGILNSLNSHIAVIDNSGEIIAVNESWKQFSTQNGEILIDRTCVGSNYYDVCENAVLSGDEIAKVAINGLKDVMKKDKTDFYLEYPCNSPTQQRWFGMRALKFESDLPMVVVAHLDITERKLAEENSIQNEARLAEAQALAKIGSWQTDLKSLNVIWSAETFRIFEINPEDFKASHPTFLEYVHPDDRVKVDEAFLNSFKSDEINFIEHRIITPSGVTKILDERWQIFCDKNAIPISAVGTCQDITERKKAEHEREKLTSDIIQRNRDLEQFAFIISHNLRSPTANIIGFAEQLQDPALNPMEFTETLHGLSLSVSKLDTVIRDLNSILQVKREINEKREWISFSKQVEDIFISIGSLIDKHQVRIRHDFSEAEQIFSLKVYIHSIFFNLISNSIKYSQPKVQPLIEIKSNLIDGNIVLHFKDNGMGIDLKTKGNKVFGLYNRFHSHVEGKGMGLFMVKTQVESLGGKISVKSEPNKGTEFIIVFEK